jgi:hypothetical protein
MVIQPALLEAVQLQPFDVVTLVLPLPPPDGKDAETGETE